MDSHDNSDSDAFSDTSSEDLDDIFSIYTGHAQSIFSNLQHTIGKLDDFLSLERAYAHGDIVVSSIAHSPAQLGRIVNVHMSVALENVFGKSVHGVNCRHLTRVRPVAPGDHVVNGPWIGRVDRVIDRVKITLDDGTQCALMASESETLIPISPNLLEDSLFPYHPGQRVKAALSPFSKSSPWLCGMLKKTHHEGVVDSVEPGSVHVDWLACALTFTHDTALLSPPSCIQDPNDLTLLPCFTHTNWLHGEYCILVQDNECDSKLEDMYSIVKRKRTYDVVWQDGSRSMGLELRSLVPVTAVNATDFFPEEIVFEKANYDDLNGDNGGRWGVVKFVNSSEKTVRVDWKLLDGGLMEETVSAYELVEHPEFNFSFGDIVFLLDKKRVGGEGEASVMRKEVMSRQKERDADSDEGNSGSFLSSIGVVVGFQKGDVQVQWASGVTRLVAPDEIIHMDKAEGSLAALAHNEQSFTEESNEGLTVQAKQSLRLEEQVLPNVDGIYERTSTSFGFQQSAFGFLTRIATKFLGSADSASQGQSLADVDMSDVDQVESFPLMPANVLNSCEDGNVEHETGKTPENDNLQFKQFDIVADCSDHHFVNGTVKGLSMSQAKRGWLKKVQQEWSILERDLPEAIYVRIYEERMDLIRAAIIGASGTPYHDGLFFFDIFLPPDYPNEPPSVHYHSGGLCLNPNLYESGRVCLSLLNTWRGSGSEVWNPGHSTILQVLLSLQALVLNEKPYFNEAGYDRQMGRSEGEKNSVSYNENAFLVTCRSMLYLLRNPPKHFEGLVEEHFQRRSKNILLACKAYMEGTAVGSFGEGKTAFGDREKENSMGFKIMLGKLFPKLMEAFSATGADCSIEA